jgi:hypothetical protein
MNESYFVSCGNVVVLSPKAISRYPAIEKYVLGYIKPIKSLLFFASRETPITKYNFGNSTPLGFSNVTVTESSQAHIDFLLGVNRKVEQELLEHIIGFFNIPKITIELDLKNNYQWDEEVRFLSTFGFANPAKSPSTENVEMTLLPPGSYVDVEANVATVAELARHVMFLCKLKVYFPPELAKLLADYVQKEPVEYGGRIFIESYVKDNLGENVAVLGTKPIYFDKGESISVNVKNVNPLMFHTHPDQSRYSYGLFLAWPSGADINVSVWAYLMNRDIVAQFVPSSEGIWIYHLKPKFQKFLYDLKQTGNIGFWLEKFLNFHSTKFATKDFETFTEIPPEMRPKMKALFIDLSKNLRISDFLDFDPSVKQYCQQFIHENFTMYDVALIKWQTFYTNKVLISFSYMSDPVGGLPCNLPVDAPYVTNVHSPISSDYVYPMLIGDTAPLFEDMESDDTDEMESEDEI